MKRWYLAAGLIALGLCAGIPDAGGAPQPKRVRVAWRSIGPGQFGAMFGVAISPHDSRVIVAGVDMGNAFMTRDGGQTWRILGRSGGKPFANPGYRGTWGVCFDPKRPERIWIGSEHGLYRSTDGGGNWRLAFGGDASHGIHAIACDPSNPDIVYAATGRGARTPVAWARGNVWKSTDGGDTWKVIYPAGGQDGAAKGRNWTTLAIDPQSPFVPGKGHQRLYLCGQAGFLVSEDAGDTWTSLDASLPGGVVSLPAEAGARSGIGTLWLAPGRERAVLFASIVVRTTDAARKEWLGGVYASADGGRTWVPRNRGLEQVLGQMAAMSSAGLRYSLLTGCAARPQVMYWACAQGVFKTEDGGASWAQATRVGTEWKKAPDYDGKEIHWRLRTHDTNFERSFYNAYGPANGLACSPTDPNAVAYTDNAGIGVSFDGGRRWTEPGFEFGEAVWPGGAGDRPAMLYTHRVRSHGIQLIVPAGLAVDPFDPKTLAIGHHDVGLVISRDGGQWWEWAYQGVLNGEKNNIHAICYDPEVRGRLWIGGGGWSASGHVYQSDDGGRAFRILGIPHLTAAAGRTKEVFAVHTIAVDPSSPKDARTLYAATDAGLYKTADGGKTWQALAMAGAASPAVLNVILDPGDPRRLYASVGKGGGLWRSEDAGASWIRLGAGKVIAVKSLALCAATGTLYALDTVRPGDAYTGQRLGNTLWRSDDRGETWKKILERMSSCAAVHPQDPECVYLLSTSLDVTKDEVNLHRSTDGGATWDALADDIPLSPGGAGNQIVFDPTLPARFFLLHNSGTWEGIEKIAD